MLIANNVFIDWVLGAGRTMTLESPPGMENLHKHGGYAINAVGFSSDGSLVHLGTIDRKRFTWNSVKFGTTADTKGRDPLSSKLPPYSYDAIRQNVKAHRHWLPKYGYIAFGGGAYETTAIASAELDRSVDNNVARAASYLISGRVVGNATQTLDRVIYYESQVEALKSMLAMFQMNTTRLGPVSYRFSAPPSHAIMLLWALMAVGSPGFSIDNIETDRRRIRFTINFFHAISDAHFLRCPRAAILKNFFAASANYPSGTFPKTSLSTLVNRNDKTYATKLIGWAGNSRVVTPGPFGDGFSGRHSQDYGTLTNYLKLFSAINSHDEGKLLASVISTYIPDTKNYPSYLTKLASVMLDQYPRAALIAGELGACIMATLTHRHLYYLQSIMLSETDVGFLNSTATEVAFRASSNPGRPWPDIENIAEIAERHKMKEFDGLIAAVKKRNRLDGKEAYEQVDKFGRVIRDRSPKSWNIGRYRAALLTPAAMPHREIGQYAEFLFRNYGVLPRSGLGQIVNVTNMTSSRLLSNTLSLLNRGIYNV